VTRWVVVVATLGIALSGCVGSGDDAGRAHPGNSPRPGAAPDHTSTALFSFRDGAIVESSGIAASSSDDRVLFTHNDSGDSPRFFAVDFRGCTLARFDVTGATATDWEDMGRSHETAGRPTLWFGDIGDNVYSRPSVQVYAVREPRISATGHGHCAQPADQQVSATDYELSYPDGSHNAEALMADPVTGRLYLVTKGDQAGETPTVYSAPLPLRRDAVNVMHKVVELHLRDPEWVTGSDISPDRRRVVVRTYTDAYEWRVHQGRVGRAMHRKPTHVALPSQPQGEAIGYTRAGHDLLVSSEDPAGTSPPVYLVSAR
jgi:hypothetical protein